MWMAPAHRPCNHKLAELLSGRAGIWLRYALSSFSAGFITRRRSITTIALHEQNDQYNERTHNSDDHPKKAAALHVLKLTSPSQCDHYQQSKLSYAREPHLVVRH